MATASVIFAVTAALLVLAGFGLAVMVQRRRWQQTETLRGLVLNHYRAMQQTHKLMDAFVAARADLRQRRGL